MALRKSTKRGGRSRGGAHFAGAKPSSATAGSATRTTQGSGAMRTPVGPDPLDGDTPRPIGVDPQATGSFERLGAGEGAILTTRDNADDAVGAARERLSGTTGMMRLDASDLPPVEEHVPKTRTNKRAVALLVVLTLAVILGGAYVFWRLTASVPAQEEEQTQAEQAQVDATDSLEYRGDTYQLEQGDDGTWHLSRQSGDEGAQAQSVGDLAGTPVAMVLYDGAIVIPENKSDGTWDIVAYMMGSGWSQLVDDEGTAYVGQGSISSATLDGSQLEVVSDSGTTEIPLNW